MNRSQSYGMLALSLLAGSTWIFSQFFSITWPSLLRLSFHDGVVAVILLGSTLIVRNSAQRRLLFEVSAWGFVLFALPVILSEAAGGSVRSSTDLLTFGLVPFLTVFFVAQHEGSEMGLLVPAVSGLAGLALLAEFSLPSTGRGAGWLALIVFAVGLIASGGIRLHKILCGVEVLPVAAAASAGASLGAFIAWCLLSSGPVVWDMRTVVIETAWAIGIDLPLTLLTMWLLREMRPTAFATRFLLVPLVTVLSGILTMRPPVLWTTWLGLALLGGASWVLLTAHTEETIALNG